MSTTTPSSQHVLTDQNKPNLSHIMPGITVLLILIGVAFLADRLATSAENQEVRGLAPLLLTQDEVGLVIQQAAFRQTDLLPVYGSSEMIMTQTPYRAYSFFSTYPTGFNVFDIAKAGDSNINIAQNLASLGPVLRGKKVVISFAPGMFSQPETKTNVYAGNFSLMHASGLIFSPYLGMTVKQEAAKRMDEYPDTLNNDILIQFAIYNLAQNTRANDFLYDLLFPLGQIDNFIFRLKDHFAIWQFIQNHHGLKVKRDPHAIDWQTALANGEAIQRANTNDNPFGIDNKIWSRKGYLGFEFHPSGSEDQAYLTRLKNSREWGDLQILLEVLKEMGAKPLILSRPINGTLYTASGISSRAQQAYYDKLKETVGAYNFPVFDFQNYTNDRLFSVDFASHTSPEGWVIVDRVLDGFYHNYPLTW